MYSTKAQTSLDAISSWRKEGRDGSSWPWCKAKPPHCNFAVEQQEVEQLVHFLLPSQWRMTQGGEPGLCSIKQAGLIHSDVFFEQLCGDLDVGSATGLEVDESQGPYWGTRLQNWPRPLMGTRSVLKTVLVQRWDMRIKCTNTVHLWYANSAPDMRNSFA